MSAIVLSFNPVSFRISPYMYDLDTTAARHPNSEIFRRYISHTFLSLMIVLSLLCIPLLMAYLF